MENYMTKQTRVMEKPSIRGAMKVAPINVATKSINATMVFKSMR